MSKHPYTKLLQIQPPDLPDTARFGWILYRDNEAPNLILSNEEDPRYTLQLSRQQAAKLVRTIQKWLKEK